MYRIRIRRYDLLDNVYIMRMRAKSAYGAIRSVPGSSYFGAPDVVENRYGGYSEWIAKTPGGRLWLMMNQPATVEIIEDTEGP